MDTETAINTGLHPYGTWYSQPGGLLFERDDKNDDLAAKRLKALRERTVDEPRYSHRKVVITYAVVGLIHLPLAFVNLGLKSAVKDIDASDWAGFGLATTVVAVFVALAVRNALWPPQRTPHSMFKGYLTAAVGFARGRAYNMLLSHDRDERLRPPPPPIIGEGGDALPFNEQNKFERYWLNAFGGSWHPWKSVGLSNVQSVELAPDLILMQAEVRVTQRSLVAQFLAFIPIIIGTVLTTIGFVVFFVAAFTLRPDRETLFYWLIPLLAPLALGMLVATIMVLRAFVPIGRRTFPVRKLLIRVNDQWRVFNGELQGADESDLGWVLELVE